jgi:hypothetical protein
VYNEVGGPIVANVMAGYNGTILAYGQTVCAAACTENIVCRLVAHCAVSVVSAGHGQDVHNGGLARRSLLLKVLLWSRCATSLLLQGILNRVDDGHAGLIPRALSHIFGTLVFCDRRWRVLKPRAIIVWTWHCCSGHTAMNTGSCEWSISMSFLQIYLETIQVRE